MRTHVVPLQHMTCICFAFAGPYNVTDGAVEKACTAAVEGVVISLLSDAHVKGHVAVPSRDTFDSMLQTP